MGVRTYAVLPAGVLERVRAALAAALAPWATGWGLAALAPACRRAWDGAAPGLLRARIAGAGGVAWLAWPDGLRQTLQDAMFAPDRDGAHAGPGSVAHAAAGAAFEALLAVLGAAACAAGPDQAAQAVSRVACAAGPDAAALLVPGSGALLVELAIGDHTLSILLDPGAVTRLAGAAPAPPPLPALAPADFGALLAPQPLRLAVEAGRARVSLGSLLALAPGDVIRLDALADHPLAAVTADGTIVLRGYLGTRNHHLALDLVAGDAPSGEHA